MGTGGTAEDSRASKSENLKRIDRDMVPLKFRTKAESLSQLKEVLTVGAVKPLLIFCSSEWREKAQDVVAQIQQRFRDVRFVIVRSSNAGEDLDHGSNAGKFSSVAGIRPGATDELTSAINRVLDSYGEPLDEQQFFVQEQVEPIRMSGVCFTRDMNTLAPYYSINYDDMSGRHDSVTSGSSNETKTYIRFRSSPNPVTDPYLGRILRSVSEIERLFQNDALDIEFAFDDTGELFILQVRPIPIGTKSPNIPDESYSRALGKVHKKLQKLNAPHPGLFGRKAIYSVMSDWNPAEMIGIKPRALALSLYKELITDSIWAYQRDNYGYKTLRSFPLLVSFLGQPYIDVRVSLNSFVPKELDDELTSKLVDYYISELIQAPTSHDKIEFDIVFSCYDLTLPGRVAKLRDFGFQKAEINQLTSCLRDLTNRIISPQCGLYRDDRAKLGRLETRLGEISSSHLSRIDKIYWLIEDCKRFGTLPFAGLARAGFIAVQFLRSFVEAGIMTLDEMDRYVGSLNTVANQLSRDFRDLRRGAHSKAAFLSKYGHLRPGTYDIVSENYSSSFDTYFSDRNDCSEQNSNPFEVTAEQRRMITERAKENGLSCDAESLLIFIRDAIEGRELGKFVFTKSVSAVLGLLEDLGTYVGLDREKMSFLNIRTVIDLYSTLSHKDVGSTFHDNIQANQEAYELTRGLRLPQLIVCENDVYDFHVGVVEPNYITQGRITEVVVCEHEFPTTDLSGKIIFLRSADPGWDWLFSRKIAGLVTLYGGANSHMAIRCAELNIPAVIGCGETNFERWSKSNALEIDCANRAVRMVRSDECDNSGQQIKTIRS